jgi:heme oxygenase (biliverdin-IX-beta and delta-forming)
MRLIDQLGEETEAFHDITDEAAFRLPGPATEEDYRGYLMEMYGFVCPLERSLMNTPAIDRYIDLHRFQKHALLRRDLSALHMSSEQIGRLPECAVPWFKTPEEALGWAYPIERSTLRHGELFRYLASIIPGVVAFASSYLKCYLGEVGAKWREFGHALDTFDDTSLQSQQAIDAAKAAFRCFRAWRFLHKENRDAVRFARLARRRIVPVNPRDARAGAIRNRR